MMAPRFSPPLAAAPVRCFDNTPVVPMRSVRRREAEDHGNVCILRADGCIRRAILPRWWRILPRRVRGRHELFFDAHVIHSDYLRVCGSTLVSTRQTTQVNRPLSAKDIILRIYDGQMTSTGAFREQPSSMLIPQLESVAPLSRNPICIAQRVNRHIFWR